MWTLQLDNNTNKRSAIYLENITLHILSKTAIYNFIIRRFRNGSKT